MHGPLSRSLTAIAVATCLQLGTSFSAEVPQHFHPEGKMPSRFTVELRNGVKKALPFDDVRDLEENRRGLVAVPAFKKIMADAGNVAWDMESYGFLLLDKDFDSIDPSLQRQAMLNMAYGLYEVLPGKVYQVRGFDLANITFIKSDSGWIIFDPLTAAETARAALTFINDKLGARPVKAVIYSHTHVDHFGGVRGVVDEADVRSGKVQVIAPENFLREAISENIFAGTAMTRRSRIQYGTLLERSPFGHVDQSIGKNLANGSTGLIAPSVHIREDFEELTVDGVRMVFQNTPDTEAPVSMNTWFPDWKAFWAAEIVTGTIHNIYTLRGAPVRNSLNWSKHIKASLHHFPDMEVMFASHSWPRWGNARIQEVLRAQRDLYANMNNQVLHLANQGVTINEIHNLYRSPPSLQRQWPARSYHGSEAINSRGIINRFIGYWDGNPINLEPLPQRESASLYVEMMGGSARIIAKARELIEQGKYLHAGELLNRVVFAEPSNQAARNLLAEAFEQLGYQRESPSLRNSYLNMAFELRSGMQAGTAPSSTGPDVIRAMATEQWLDFLGISMDSRKADGMRFSINLVTPDNGEKFLVEMSNATLTNIKGFTAPEADLTITINRSDLNQIMMGVSSFEELESHGKVRFSGDRRPLAQLAGILTQFTPDFEVFPGTKNAQPTPASTKPFQLVIQPAITFAD